MNFKRMYTVKNGGASGWTESTHTTFILSIEDDVLAMTVKAGRNPFPGEINTAFGRLISEYQAQYGTVEKYERAYPYRFTYQEGSSGRQTTFIEIDKGDGFPERKRLLDMSCFGKVGRMSLFVYDFLDLCVADGFFKVLDGNYVYDRESDEFGKDVEMMTIKPRITELEPGWTSCDGSASEIVSIYDIVREGEEPEEDPEEAEEADSADEESDNTEEPT